MWSRRCWPAAPQACGRPRRGGGCRRRWWRQSRPSTRSGCVGHERAAVRRSLLSARTARPGRPPSASASETSASTIAKTSSAFQPTALGQLARRAPGGRRCRGFRDRLHRGQLGLATGFASGTSAGAPGAGATPATSASVACTRRRSCSTQRGQLRRCTSSRASSRSVRAPSMRSEIRRSERSHQPLPGRAATVRRSSLRARASESASSSSAMPSRIATAGRAVPARATSASAVRSRSPSAGRAAATSVTAAASGTGPLGRPGTGRSGARSMRSGQ